LQAAPTLWHLQPNPQALFSYPSIFSWITQVQADMLDGGLAAIDSLTAFIDAALAAGGASVAASSALDAQLAVVKAGSARQMYRSVLHRFSSLLGCNRFLRCSLSVAGRC
jgi:hypothetical protein